MREERGEPERVEREGEINEVKREKPNRERDITDRESSCMQKSYRLISIVILITCPVTFGMIKLKKEKQKASSVTTTMFLC